MLHYHACPLSRLRAVLSTTAWHCNIFLGVLIILALSSAAGWWSVCLVEILHMLVVHEQKSNIGLSDLLYSSVVKYTVYVQ